MVYPIEVSDGHVTLNENKFQKSVRKKIEDSVLEYQNSQYCMHIGGGDRLNFEIGHFRNFRTSVTLTFNLDRVIRHTHTVV